MNHQYPRKHSLSKQVAVIASVSAALPDEDEISFVYMPYDRYTTENVDLQEQTAVDLVSHGATRLWHGLGRDSCKTHRLGLIFVPFGYDHACVLTSCRRLVFLDHLPYCFLVVPDNRENHQEDARRQQDDRVSRPHHDYVHSCLLNRERNKAFTLTRLVWGVGLVRNRRRP